MRSCPFCGCENVIVTLYNHPSVVCQGCWAVGPKGPRLSRSGGENFMDTVQESSTVEEAKRIAVERWNKRTGDQ